MLKGHVELYVVRKGDKMCVFMREKKRKVRWEGEGGRKRKKWGDAVRVCVGVRAVGGWWGARGGRHSQF